MRDNYDGSEYGQVTVGRGKSVHFGNVKDGITACGKRGYLQDASGHEVTCKVCMKMAETTHDGSRPLIKDEVAAALVEPEPMTGAQTAALRLVTENGGAATVREVAQALTGNVRPDAATSRRVQGVLRSLVQHGHLAVTREGGKVTYRLPTQAETMLPEALTAVTETAHAARQLFDAYTATDLYDQQARGKAHTAWQVASRRAERARKRAYGLGAEWHQVHRAIAISQAD